MASSVNKWKVTDDRYMWRQLKRRRRVRWSVEVSPGMEEWWDGGNPQRGAANMANIEWARKG